jgi:hypothetical protein
MTLACLVALTLGGTVEAANRPAGAVPGVAFEACPAEVALYDWPVDEACSVSWCESRWQPWAFNAGNYGYFQVNAVHGARVDWNLDALFDPATNVRVAYAIWRDGGWGPWACRP